jgi:hypothetical protein
MEAYYLIPRICEATYKDSCDLVMRRRRFQSEDSISARKEALLSDPVARHTQIVPPATSFVVYLASTPSEQPHEISRYQPHVPCSRCGRQGHHSRERCWQAI